MVATVFSKGHHIVIAGAGRFGREVETWLRTYGGYYVVGFIDDLSDAPDVIGRIVDHSAIADVEYVVAIGDSAGRLKVGRELQRRGCHLAMVRSPHALVAHTYIGAPGGMLLGCCDISANVVLGQHVLVQGFACIGHDVTLGDGVTVSSHVFIGGGAKIGEAATLHPHSVILPNICVGEGAIVGAGAIVTKDVRPNTTVFGNPARLLVNHAGA